MAEVCYALSLKQPWAALLAHGRKTIEVRRWPTARRGRVLIHASQVPDERPEAWAHVPPELQPTAALRGGIIGAGDLTGCITYGTVDAFAADQGRHLNELGWFQGPVLYGFTFANLTVLPFRSFPGWMRFFPVEDATIASFSCEPAASAGLSVRETINQGSRLNDHLPGLLVSVRSVEEVEVALAGGAALIDVKDPLRGPLGQAPSKVIRAVIDTVAGRRPVSAALGELLALNAPLAQTPLDYVKWGLAGCGRRADWPKEWRTAAERIRQVMPGCRPVAVAYADWRRAKAPPPEDVGAFARDERCGAFLLDTWSKDGSTLLDWLSLDAIAQLRQTAGVPVALAGSLGPAQIRELLPLRPDWFAVRGSVCKGGRLAKVDPVKVRQLADLLTETRRES